MNRISTPNICSQWLGILVVVVVLSPWVDVLGLFVFSFSLALHSFVVPSVVGTSSSSS